MIDILLLEIEGAEIRFTDQSAASSYGLPVLRMRTEGFSEDFGPADVICEPGSPIVVTAAQYVFSWATSEPRVEEDLDAVRAFLRQWPVGPQL